MNDINPEFIERYQILYEQNPKSRIFAPLAEAYRKMGLLEEALEIAQSGVAIHSQFSGGFLVLGRILIDQQHWEEALIHLKKAVELSPENLLAQTSLADLLLQLKDLKGALKAYKMLLFLQPNNQRAQRAVIKLESLTADEYESDVFIMQPIKEALRAKQESAFSKDTLKNLTPTFEDKKLTPITATENKRRIERFLSLADAFLVRNDIDRAQETLNEAEREFGQHPEIMKRFRLLTAKEEEDREQKPILPQQGLNESNIAPLNREQKNRKNKIQFLQHLQYHMNDAVKARLAAKN